MASGFGKRFGTRPWFAEPKLVDYGSRDDDLREQFMQQKKQIDARERDQRTGIGHNQRRQIWT